VKIGVQAIPHGPDEEGGKGEETKVRHLATWLVLCLPLSVRFSALIQATIVYGEFQTSL